MTVFEIILIVFDFNTCTELQCAMNDTSLTPSFHNVQNRTLSPVYGSVAEFDCRVSVNHLDVGAINVTVNNNNAYLADFLNDSLLVSKMYHNNCTELDESDCYTGLRVRFVYLNVDMENLLCVHHIINEGITLCSDPVYINIMYSSELLEEASKMLGEYTCSPHSVNITTVPEPCNCTSEPSSSSTVVIINTLCMWTLTVSLFMLVV